MVFITIVTGAYKPTYILGASHCRDLNEFNLSISTWEIISKSSRPLPGGSKLISKATSSPFLFLLVAFIYIYMYICIYCVAEYCWISFFICYRDKIETTPSSFARNVPSPLPWGTLGSLCSFRKIWSSLERLSRWWGPGGQVKWQDFSNARRVTMFSETCSLS